MAPQKICLLLAFSITAGKQLHAQNETTRSFDAAKYADTAVAAALKNWFMPIEVPDSNFLKKEQATPTPAPGISNVEHIILHYNKETYCGHPRMVNFKYFPPNE